MVFLFYLYNVIRKRFRFRYIINKITPMARAMFEYTKTVLKKVSFSSDLFCKELEKAIQRLLPHEINELSIWLKQYTSNKPELYACMSIIK